MQRVSLSCNLSTTTPEMLVNMLMTNMLADSNKKQQLKKQYGDNYANVFLLKV